MFYSIFLKKSVKFEEPIDHSISLMFFFSFLSLELSKEKKNGPKCYQQCCKPLCT